MRARVGKIILYLAEIDLVALQVDIVIVIVHKKSVATYLFAQNIADLCACNLDACVAA